MNTTIHMPQLYVSSNKIEQDDTACSISENNALIITKPLVSYLLEILFWLTISITLGFLMGWAFKLNNPDLPELTDVSKLSIVKQDLVICENAANAILRRKTIQFAIGSAKISQNGLSVIDDVIKVIRKCEGAKLTIEGHTDNTGTYDGNMSLSKRRADAVANVIRNNGLTGFKINTVGFGSSKPVETNATVEGRRQNRRIEMRLYE